MADDIVLVDVEDYVALITFNHASRNNAWSEPSPPPTTGRWWRVTPIRPSAPSS